MSTKMPAEVFPPGEYLADELAERGWSQADFAGIISRPVQFVSEIINAKKELTAESAAQIGAALGSEPETWLSLQARYRLWQLAQDADHQRAASRGETRARIAAIIPLVTLEARGLLDPEENPTALLARVMTDFGMSVPTDSPRFCLAAKRSNRDGSLTLTQRGWLWSARELARGQELPDYNATAFRALAEGLARAASTPDDLADLPERFAQCGVHLVFVEHLPGGKIDGAAFMLDAHPVVAVSGRGKRFDKLFFALLHECAHVLAGHVAAGVALDDLDSAAATPGERKREAEANDLAERWALGGRVKLDGPATAIAVAAKAQQLGVPGCFVVGNLQHHHDLDWRTTLARGIPNADHVWRGWSGKRG